MKCSQILWKKCSLSIWPIFNHTFQGVKLNILLSKIPLKEHTLSAAIFGPVLCTSRYITAPGSLTCVNSNGISVKEERRNTMYCKRSWAPSFDVDGLNQFLRVSVWPTFHLPLQGFLSQYGYFRQGGVPLNLQLAQPGGADYRPERDADSEAIR